jgi:hypothetical protein
MRETRAELDCRGKIKRTGLNTNRGVDFKKIWSQTTPHMRVPPANHRSKEFPQIARCSSTTRITLYYRDARSISPRPRRFSRRKAPAALPDCSGEPRCCQEDFGMYIDTITGVLCPVMKVPVLNVSILTFRGRFCILLRIFDTHFQRHFCLIFYLKIYF